MCSRPPQEVPAAAAIAAQGAWGTLGSSPSKHGGSGLHDTDQSSVLELWTSCADQHFSSERVADYPMTARVLETLLRVLAHGPLRISGGSRGRCGWHADPSYFTAQPRAREAVRSGLIPADFACPVSSKGLSDEGRFGGMRRKITETPFDVRDALSRQSPASRRQRIIP